MRNILDDVKENLPEAKDKQEKKYKEKVIQLLDNIKTGLKKNKPIKWEVDE